MNDYFIDWDAVQRRLKTVDEAIARSLSRGKAAALLEERAMRLAKPLPEAVETDWMEVVEFSLGKERYAFENRLIEEVCPLREYTPLPGTPDFVAGLINVRGKILSIINLKSFLGIEDPGIGELNKVIILRDAAMEFGVLADEIRGVKKILRSEIFLPLATMTGRRAEFIIGIEEGGCALIDAQKLLSDERIIVCEQP